MLLMLTRISFTHVTLTILSRCTPQVFGGDVTNDTFCWAQCFHWSLTWQTTTPWSMSVTSVPPSLKITFTWPFSHREVDLFLYCAKSRAQFRATERLKLKDSYCSAGYLRSLVNKADQGSLCLTVQPNVLLGVIQHLICIRKQPNN